MLRQGELAAGPAQAIDHLDGHDVGRTNGFLSLWQMSVNDLVEVKKLPEPKCQPDVTEPSRICPADRAQADPYNVRIVRSRDLVIVRE